MFQIAKLMSDEAGTKELMKFYRHLMVHCVFVSDHVNRIKSTLGPGDELITRALGIFEALICKSIATSGAESNGRPYARQYALNERWDGMRDCSLGSKIDYAKSCLVIPDSSTLQEHDESFDEWQADVVSMYPEDGLLVDDQPRTTRRAEPSYVIRNAAQSLFEALIGSNKCECHPVHELDARLCIGTYRKPQVDRDHDFDMLLGCNHDLQEVRVYTTGDTTVRFVVDNEAQANVKKLDYKPMMVKALCKQVEKMQKTVSQRLELKVERRRLFKLRSKMSSFRIDKNKPPVSLQQVIQKGARLLTEKTKRILAVLLSYAVLHLHDTPWIRPNWDSSQVLFFHTPASKIPLRPFVQAQLLEQNDDKNAVKEAFGVGISHKDLEDVDPDDLEFDDLDPDDVGHPLPILVTLAIMLMELYFATPFEALAKNRDLRVPESTDSPTRSLDVAVIFDAYKREMPRNSQFYHAVEKCLDPWIWQGEWGESLGGDLMREKIYREVIRPLEDELCDAFDYITIDELDQIAETLDVVGWGQAIENKEEQELASESSVSPMGLTMLQQIQHPTKSLFALPTHLLVGLNPSAPIDMQSVLLTPGSVSSKKMDYDGAKFYDDEKPSSTHTREE
jgi:hypothetical protein